MILDRMVWSGVAGCVAAAFLCGGCMGASDAVGLGEEAPAEATEGAVDGRLTTENSPPWGTSTSGSESSSGDGPGIGFITDPDGGSAHVECSLWEQDCAADEKCTVWAPDGGSLDGTRCVSLYPHAGLEGEPCQGERATGIDTCEAGAFCWDMDPETQLGVCMKFCEGTELDPVCADPLKTCNFNKQFAVCLEQCQPLLNDCPVGCGCYPVLEGFQCAPDASGDAGGYLEPCEFINACDAGLVCLDSAVLRCEGNVSCCGQFCDLSAPVCPKGQECHAAFGEGEALPLHEEVGYCYLPDMSAPQGAEPGWDPVVP